MNEIITRLKTIVDVDTPVVLEVGACEGKDSRRFLDIFGNIRLWCFEPDPKNCQDHRQLISPGDTRCKLKECAIGDKDGEVIFHRSGGRNRRASGSLRNPKEHLQMHPWCTFDEDITVPCLRLDTWYEINSKQFDFDIIDLIWADVNGAETSMIAGAQEALVKTKYLYTEFGPDGHEIYQGGVTKEQIKKLLPDFEEMFVHSNNVLLRNKVLT
jgi:FkbM family methyltransferase